MQYHLNGFHPGVPFVAKALDATDASSATVDVLIVGCGPAGLTLAAQLSAFPEITTRITERKSGPLEVGQADGIACRSIEMFQAFGFAEKVIKEGYWVNEVAFWRPLEGGSGLQRADRIQDVAEDLSEMPHVILNQARVHDFHLEVMHNSPHRLTPDYNRELIELSRSDDADYPITATFRCLDGDRETEIIRARYVVGCDGAHSTVRTFIGQALKGTSARQLWGVMDVLAITDFPDIRLKTAIQSADQGSILIIPREGGYMVRMYIELDELHGDERAADRKVSSEMLIEKARAIFAPYSLDVKEVAWWSAYEIAQRLCDAFDDVPDGERRSRNPNIFIAGDACHTHSPKAGQGMNVSMADTFNLGWKLAAVLRGQAAPALLHSYSEERRAKAKELIDFDRDMARLFSAKPKDAAEAAQFQRFFQKHGRYTAGVETRYQTSLITAPQTHQTLAAGFKVGMRFHSAPVIRLGDGKPMQLGHTLKADGRWRLIAFAATQDSGQPGGGIARLCDFLTANPDSPVVRFTPKGADIDSLFDLRAVFQLPHQSMTLETLPKLLLPTKGIHRLTDYEKAFCPDLKQTPDIFDMRGIDRNTGALLIIRPDQHVAHVLPLDGFEELAVFFQKIMVL
ncbi:FAD-dependent monooxygenase [Parasedimentitalea psychrophila]|uniref:FAD-dependent monooxygenase n=1 Tax=Parasedimentitalea psychrophila TaxID=2997337 RepID=A0A9Y2P3A5_9RHOB|nr:FAD-dependent monooxygenase [Parasedimentitalea psychrophila]WIY24074.1 FAD-dependent monooxygenase [Parasedimentitalea psychrophila]